jgi:hypothetical protein
MKYLHPTCRVKLFTFVGKSACECNSVASGERNGGVSSESAENGALYARLRHDLDAAR